MAEKNSESQTLSRNLIPDHSVIQYEIPLNDSYENVVDARPNERSNNQSSSRTVKRDLKARHLTMIALGGTIGTGVFMNSGHQIASAGPGSTLIAYIVVGLMVYFLMTGLTEMSTYIPLTGSFSTFPRRFIDSAIGFAAGWNYWLENALMVSVQFMTAGIILSYWFPTVEKWVFSLISMVILFAINILNVKSFGEAEFWLALIKIVTIVIFIIIGILQIFGVPHGPAPYFQNFVVRKSPFVDGIIPILKSFVFCTFSFAGTEMVGVSAGESSDSETSIPKATNQVITLIMFCYLLTFFIIGCLFEYDDPILGGKEITASVFTIVFQKTGIPAAAHIINAVILTAVLSAANSCIYTASRTLYSLSVDGFAPRFLSTTTKKGVPLYSIIASTSISIFAFTTSIYGPEFYEYMILAVGLSVIVNWLIISVTHWRFRRAVILQYGETSRLPYVARFFPIGPIFTFCMCVVVIFVQDLESFMKGKRVAIVVEYMTIPLFIILVLFYKFYYKTKIVPLSEVDLNQAAEPEFQSRVDSVENFGHIYIESEI